MKCLRVKLVPYYLTFSVYLLWPFGVALSEPVESNAPAAPNADTDSSRIFYDQRQSGKYNIHVSIKDVAIIEVDQNGIEDISYNDDDYYYDEGHLTVKPILLNPITASNQSNSSSTTTTKPTTLSFNQDSTTIITPPTTTISNNQTYSPNLLADIAATHSTNSSNITTNSTISSLPALNTTKGRTQNVIILDKQSLTHNSPSSTHKPTMSTTIQSEEILARSKDAPIQSILRENLLHAYQPGNTLKLPLRPYLRFVDAATDETISNSQQQEQENDSKIFKFKVRRANKQVPASIKASGAAVGYPFPHLHALSARRCRAHQYRDASGDCRAKRSSSILKKLFSMLVTLPFSNQRPIDDRDDE